MTVLNGILTLLILGLSASFYLYAKAMQRQIRRLKTQLQLHQPDLATDTALPPSNTKPDKSGAELQIAVEIIDPIALANRETRMSRFISGFAPNYVTREVYRQVRDEIHLALKNRLIDARVTIENG